MISQVAPGMQSRALRTTPRQRCRLFAALMDRACRLSGLSRRQLARQLGVAVGSVNNYYLGKVDPLDNRLVIQQRLARLNGMPLEAVVAFYESGDWTVIETGEPQLQREVLRGLRPRGTVRTCQHRPCQEISRLSAGTAVETALLEPVLVSCSC